ncbi:acyltransferase domain-containing protein, partial [Frankia sp. AiPa1]|uniref:acyltransferase domain-containing protein n=1 Tax=Frankia sp. AiPa1 TaxID=573492 RepID=UPI00202B3822
SSFGISGTNAHLILEQPPTPNTNPNPNPDTPDSATPDSITITAGPSTTDRPAEAFPFLISARTEAGLRGQAERLAAYLETAGTIEPAAAINPNGAAPVGPTPPDVAWSLVHHRAHLPHRAVVVAADAEELSRGLAQVATSRTAPNIVLGRPRPTGKVAFLYTGQGSQRAGMGQQLYARSTVFADALDTVCDALDVHLSVRLRDLMFAVPGSPEEQLLHTTEYAQPALFA